MLARDQFMISHVISEKSAMGSVHAQSSDQYMHSHVIRDRGEWQATVHGVTELDMTSTTVDACYIKNRTDTL